MATCAVSGCKPEPGATFHYLPKNPRTRVKWLDFIYRHHAHIPTHVAGLRICNAHFSDECFQNTIPRSLGFLILKNDAVPTVYPGTATASGAQCSTSSSDPSAMGCIGTNIACQQTSFQVQNSETTMVQLVAPTGIVLLTPTLPLLPLVTFAPFSDPPPTNHPESQPKTNSVACQFVSLQVRERGTYIRTRPTHTKNKGIQVNERSKDVFETVNEKRLAKLESPGTQHIVDEDAILELLKVCPECNRQCRLTKRTQGIYFIVSQGCYFCNYRGKWTNQPEAKDIRLNCLRKRRTRKRRPLDKVSLKASVQPPDLKECSVAMGSPCPIPNDQ